MPIRSITRQGVEWTVWNVVPSLDSRVHVPFQEGNANGWLCLQSASEKRRIVPAPQGWEDWSDEELLRRLEGAMVVQAAPHLVREDIIEAPATASAELRERVEGTISRARDLGERVRRAMDSAGAPPGGGLDWRERGPEPGDDR
jgi:hypothetical protein